jgi:Na+/H+ antiporter NhaD/arsenite permease-like protein
MKMKKNTFGFIIFTLIFFQLSDSFAIVMNPELFEISKNLQSYWGIPFAGMLLSIALFPLFAPHFWEKYYSIVTFCWTLLFIIPFSFIYTPSLSSHLVIETIIEEYLPFILLLLALYTITGGIHISGKFAGTPTFNLIFITIGTLLASFIGTTGASMLFIRPLIRANAWRKHRVHTIVFFIFLVSNIGGSLTPIGDPPLFIGFLMGVGFFWTMTHMFLPFLIACVLLLVVYYFLEQYFFKRDHDYEDEHAADAPRLKIEGKRNFWLLLIVILAVFLSGQFKNDYALHLGELHLKLNSILRDSTFILLTILSIKRTSSYIREHNHFSWEPIKEVGILFIGIFITIIPMILILKAGLDGAFKPLVELSFHADGTPNNNLFFWLTGILSSFLDNAPTYLVFFNLAGGDANHLMTALSTTLIAISAGSVFMGANSYIGNAPNMMVKAIAESRGIKMPSFFGYMVWVLCINIPIFLIISFLFF